MGVWELSLEVDLVTFFAASTCLVSVFRTRSRCFPGTPPRRSWGGPSPPPPATPTQTNTTNPFLISYVLLSLRFRHRLGLAPPGLLPNTDIVHDPSLYTLVESSCGSHISLFREWIASASSSSCPLCGPAHIWECPWRYTSRPGGPGTWGVVVRPPGVGTSVPPLVNWQNAH